MLHAKESLKILLQVVESHENVLGTPNILLSSIPLNVCIKILENFGRLPLTEQNGKTPLHTKGWISQDTEREGQ